MPYEFLWARMVAFRLTPPSLFVSHDFGVFRRHEPAFARASRRLRAPQTHLRLNFPLRELLARSFSVGTGKLNRVHTLPRHTAADEVIMAIEIPSDDQVVATLANLGNSVTARALCKALVDEGHPVQESQIAIQRAAERGRIQIHDDWTLSVVPEAVAA